jgi:metal-responsive CopG/Arc/MetJ family transcriptional regulator
MGFQGTRGVRRVHIDMTDGLLALVDEMAANDTPEGEDPNRSKFFRRLVREELKRREEKKAAG